MPTSTETGIPYIPRNLVFYDDKHILSTQSVRDVTVDVQQVTDVPSTGGLSITTKIIIGTAVAIGIAIAIAVTVALVITLVVNNTTTTMTTVTTTTSVTTSSTTVMAAPTNLVTYRGNINQTYRFILTGSNSGSIWGTTIYTDDSNLAVASVHSGFVALGQTCIVTVIILPGQSSYSSTTQNGITSTAFGSWSGSYSFLSSTPAG